MKLTKTEFGLIIILISISIIGFMVKLPAVFRHHDRELHFLFYLLTALFLYLNFGKSRLINYVIIFILLLIFGIGIEAMQELSNQIVNKKIHGNFDPLDVLFNVFGLFVATLFWAVSYIVKMIINKHENTK